MANYNSQLKVFSALEEVKAMALNNTMDAANPLLLWKSLEHFLKKKTCNGYFKTIKHILVDGSYQNEEIGEPKLSTLKRHR
ncbi:hypothetical protein ATANTOWER_009723, partial [Ataeniobius toweri]|nr:hypothetical protein [Ataeniobius toweri]